MDDAGGLSLAVRLGELNDFLEQSQDCVVDLERPRLIKLQAEEKAQAAQVSLTDCLACSGCVTTAETVLLTKHNYEALISALSQPTPVVISLSAVTEAVLLALFGSMSRPSLYGALQKALPAARAIYSSDFAECIVTSDLNSNSISSHCPSAVLFAEKLEHQMIPHINTTAPVQIWQGAIVKYLDCSQKVTPWDLCVSKISLPRKCYHVMVNSCADKKIETVRPEFEGLVDLSLTTDEFLAALQICGLTQDTFHQMEEFSSPIRWELCHKLAFLYGCAAREPYNMLHADGWVASSIVESSRIKPKQGLNRDHQIYGPVAVASGLRNLKNISAPANLPKSEDSKVELLACPQGCFNGPGHSKVYTLSPTCKAEAKALFCRLPRWKCLKPNLAIRIIKANRPNLKYILRRIEQSSLTASNW